MNVEQYRLLHERVVASEYGGEVEWQENVQPCSNAAYFLANYVWVVISAGMKNQVARIIEERVWRAVEEERSVHEAFRHKGKAGAIIKMMGEYLEVFGRYKEAEDKLAFLERLTWVGPITKYHLAKNLGLDVAKPDRHLVRIAQGYATTPEALCRRLAEESGYRMATVDLVIWRAANLGWL